MNDTITLIIEELSDIKTAILNFDEGRRKQKFTDLDSVAPPISMEDFLLIIDRLQKKFSEINTDTLNDDDKQRLADFYLKLSYLRENNIPNYQNWGNLPGAISSIMTTLLWADFFINPYAMPWSTTNEKLLPKELKKDLDQIQRQINKIIPDKQDLEEKVAAIHKASPLVNEMSEKLGELASVEEEINKYKKSCDKHYKYIDEIAEKVKAKETEIESVITKANNAYRIATTAGLAGAFEQRAKSLRYTMLWWIGGLVSALVLGGFIGANRFKAVHTALNSEQKIDPAYIWILIFLSILSFGAPIWFAWLSTKQIGERFKLSEDYAFKASVAKAYEGYRKEAINISPEMESRLFSSALTRLDELPLRFMDKNDHGSPWQELLNNPSIVKIFKEKPEVFKEYLDLAKSALNKSEKKES